MPAGAESNGSEPAAGARHPEPASTLAIGPRARASFAASLAPPARDLLVVAGEQHVRNAPPTVLRRTRVVRVLGIPLQRGAEGLLGGRVLVPERARELAQDRVAQHHRGQLAAAEHVAPDRHDVAREVLYHPLVEALI